MRMSRQQSKYFARSILGHDNPLLNHVEGMREVGVPRIFYCPWLPENTAEEIQVKHKIQDQYPNCCFNHVVGLPTIKFEQDDENQESDPIPLMGFNKRMLDNYHQHKRYSQNKCRGSGSSEMLTVRYMVFKYGVMNVVQNHKCITCAGTRLASSLEFSKRAKQIADTIPQIYQKMPSSASPAEMVFRTGGRMLYFPASPSAIRGQENVGDIILEECAHWDLVDDIEVYRASEFVFTKTKCHILHLTTPRGKRGFYYRKVWDPEVKTNYYRHRINWREITGVPIPAVEDLFGMTFNTAADIRELREECVHMYKTDAEYQQWFDEYFDGLTMQQVIDVPNIILDLNHIIEQAETSPNDYDQELDNQFIATENRAIGDFAEDDFDPVDLRELIDNFDARDYQ